MIICIPVTDRLRDDVACSFRQFRSLCTNARGAEEFPFLLLYVVLCCVVLAVWPVNNWSDAKQEA